MRNRAIILAAAVAVMLSTTTAADAIEKCKVKVSKKTGLIEVSATGVGGPLLWGQESGAESNAFENAGTCLDGDKAKKCTLADPASVAAKTPPADCTLYLDDGVAACSAWIPGCVPGAREPGGGGGLVVTDANGAVVGPAYPTNQVLVDVGAPRKTPVEHTTSGTFEPGANSVFHYFESSDCTGTGYMFANSSSAMTLFSYFAEGILYYTDGPGTALTMNSIAWVAASHTDASACLSKHGALYADWVAPNRCCFVDPYGPVSSSFDTPETFDLSVFVEPLSFQ